MAFKLVDVASMFYQSLDEGVPTSSTDVTTSRITIPGFLVALTYVLDTINSLTPFVQHGIISVTANKRHYQLPSDFITELAVRYRGIPLRRAIFNENFFVSGTVQSNPYQYDIIYPGTTSSAITPTGNMYLILDPAPSETSPVGTPPVFPTFNDVYLVIMYRARIPTDFTSANYTTYNFNLPNEMRPILVDLAIAKIMSAEGKGNIWQEVMLQATNKIKEFNAYVQSIAEMNPEGPQDRWWGD